MATCVYLVCIVVASFVVLARPVVAQGTNTNFSFVYPARVLQGDGSQSCPSQEIERARNEIRTASQLLVIQSYSCGGPTGWRRVAYLNMSDPSQQCPSVWKEITTPHRVCGRRSTSASCEGLTYSTGSEQYDQVCGRIIGYQLSTPDAFGTGSSQSIDSYYMDGLSVTHGSPRQHIWSFVGGLDEVTPPFACPCVNGSTTRDRIPSFVGQNYFCESGITQYSDGINGPLFSNGDPLWDGQGCGPTSSCCTFNSPPWFNVQLSSLTTGDIEVRICGDQAIGDEDTPIYLIELYVK